MSVLILLPIFTWTILIVIRIKQLQDWREGFLSASVILGCGVVFITEALSQADALRFDNVLLYWVVTFVLALYVFINTNQSAIFPFKSVQPLTFSIILITGIGIITAALALSAPPNTWDSMTYHLPRVMHWIQNESVAHYPSHIQRQLYLPPFAEFVILHFQVLTAGDRFANLVQWFSFVGCIAGVSLITRELGGNQYFQGFSAVFVATLPMGILQSTSTQNDLVVSFWVVCFVYFGLRLQQCLSWEYSVHFGLSLGLAVLTKGTGYIYIAPFVIWFILGGVKKYKSAVLPHICVIIFSIVLLNAGHYIRNYTLYGSPLSTANATYSNESFSPSTVVSNLVRNLSLHFISPHPAFNRSIEDAVKSFHVLLGISAEDPTITWRSVPYALSDAWLSEDTAGNAIHLIIVILALAVALTKNWSLSTVKYGLVIAASYVLFCSLLKWQPWSTRLQLPLFVLASPLVVVFDSLGKRSLLAGQLLLFLMSMPWLLLSSYRPVLGRESIFFTDRWSQYFIAKPKLKPSYDLIIKDYNTFTGENIGLILGNDSWEYPLWVATKYRAKIHHVAVTNTSAAISHADGISHTFVDLRSDAIRIFPARAKINDKPHPQ